MHTNGLPIDVPAGALTLVFAPVSGLTTPPNLSVNIAQNQSLALSVRYAVPNLALNSPAITTTSLPIGAQGLAYSARISALFAPTAFTAVLTNPLAATVDLNALGLTLDNAGNLRGSIPPGALAGEYILMVTAANSKGSDTRTFQLQISTAGTLSVTCDLARGNFSPAAPDKVPVGARVSFTAKPKSSAFVFDSWTETFPGETAPVVRTRNATISLFMPQSLNLVANFIPTPFPALAGNYYGLLSAAGTTVDSRGFLKAKLTAQGSFTGSFTLGNKAYTMRGALSREGSFVGVIKGGAGRSDVTLTLQLDLTNNTQTLTGALTLAGATSADGSGTTFTLAANRAAFSARLPAPQALGRKSARYSIAIPHPADSALPQGDGFGTLTVTSAGALRFVGTLGDGSAVTAATGLGENGEWPFYGLPAAYHKTGCITGALRITATPVPAVSGNLDWLKAADRAPFQSRYYPAGFTLSISQGNAQSVIGAPLGTTPLAGLTQLTLNFAGGALSSPPSPLIITLNPTNGVGTGVTAFKLVPATGLFSGKFTDGNSIIRPFSGVFLPATSPGAVTGFGVFGGNSQQTGSVEF